MAKKILKSGLTIDSIAPNILLSQIENTAPFLFKKEVDVTRPKREYLEKIIFYKKNLKQLKSLSLSDYFYFCLCAHWSTAGSYVPTDVDSLIRQKLWLHPSIDKHIERMANITIDSWSWDYSPMTNRKSYNQSNEVMSTHEGTWLSVAIGAYCALKKKGLKELTQNIQEVILKEIKKEEELMFELREKREHISFIQASPLIAHNFGDLDRVMIAWDMHESDNFCKSIFKLGHELNPNYSNILVYTGKVNKEFTSKENHRHMSLRKSRALRKSKDFLVPVAPFMDSWGKTLALTDKINNEEKASIIAALFEGFKREQSAIGYARAYGQMNNLLNELQRYLPFDLVKEIKGSEFENHSKVSLEDFESGYSKRLEEFICPITNEQF